MQISAQPVHFQTNPQLGNVFGIPVREDVLFTDAKGQMNQKSKKRVEKLLAKMQEPLRQFLKKDETVFYIAQAQVPMSALEQFTMNWVMYGLFQCVLVFTDRRILHLNQTRDGSWSHSVKQAQWAGMREVKITSSLFARNLKITHGDGTKEVYARLRFFAGKKLKAIIPCLKEQAEPKTAAVQGFEQLCPQCTATLAKGLYLCSQCGTTFKNESTLVQRLLLIPGGGYFYCGLKALGIFVGLIEAIFLLELISILATAGKMKISTGDLAAAMFALLFILVLEKGVAYLHCRTLVRQYIVEKQSQFASSAKV